MRAAPDNDLDLEKLFLPAWAQEPSSAAKYAKYEGGEREERTGRRDDRRGRRPPGRGPGPEGRAGDDRGRREQRPPARREGRPGDRPAGDNRPRPGQGGPRRPRPPGDDRGPRDFRAPRERGPTEPPKGKYTFVAQCGLSGVILGPPNHHDYQNQLRKLHADRFSRMPVEAFKARIKIVRDEEVVKKWVEDQSWKTEYVCLNMPEPLRLPSREAVEQHFRQSHKDNIIKMVESHTLAGTAARGILTSHLARLARETSQDQRRF